ncbi:MAG: murein hydrolase activator EnvC family protein [Pseudomonadota bacterium]
MGRARGWALAAILIAMLATGPLVRAQAPGIEEQKARLARANQASRVAQARARSLEREAAAERDQAAQAKAREAAAAARIQAAAADIAAAQARIAIVDRALGVRRTRLAERQGPILRLIAALQSLARRPPVLALVQPGSTADMVHVRAVLGTALPVIERRTADVRAELERVRGLRVQAEQAVVALREGQQRLEDERLGLVRLEAQHRARSRELSRSALQESDRAIALGERARDIVDSMQTMGAAEEVRASLETLAGPLPRPDGTAAADGNDGPRRAAPYRLPAVGAVVTGFGELSDTGVRARGVTLATAPGAPIVAPARGSVTYAGNFRDYGFIVILDHGGGWTSLVTGFGASRARAGDRVEQGAPLGNAGTGDDPHVTVELRRKGRPMDLTALLG